MSNAIKEFANKFQDLWQPLQDLLSQYPGAVQFYYNKRTNRYLPSVDVDGVEDYKTDTDMRYSIRPFNSLQFDFVDLLNKLLDTTSLEDLFEQHDELFKVSDDSKTSFHKKFYDKYREGWPEMVTKYEQFIAEVIAPGMGETFLYQKFPTIRFHLNGNVAVGDFHNDGEFGHPKGELNFIIPLTNSNGTASVWIESEPGLKDFQPVKMTIGNLIQFNGNELTHGNKVNDTNKTRVSMDFRVLPLSKYDEANASESMTLKTKFKEGEYYKRFTK